MTRWARVEPCGTAAAHRRHYRHGEPPCPACRRAHATRVATHRAINGRPPRS